MAEKGDVMNPYGRPKKLVSTLLTDLKAAGYERIGPGSIADIIESMIGLSSSEVSRLSVDPDQPICVRIIAKGMQSKKGFDALQTLLDRAHGKAKQQVDLSGSGSFQVPVINVTVQATAAPDGK